MNNRAGYLKTNLTKEMAYQSFVPSSLPPSPAIEVSQDMIDLLVKANSKIAVLESMAIHIPNVNLFVSMYVRKEALLSSQIEGTQATLEDVFDPLIEANTNRNVIDVVNYIKASEFAINKLSKLPLCNRLIKQTHAVLMQGVRGQEKSPGEFRRSQNWIGGQGSTLHNARYIPPSPDDMNEAMSELERYINSDDDLDVLIRAALIHYQFETIHPFLDGNGRIGRLLITLFLMQENVLTTPALYISYFLKKNRVEYYDRMSVVRRSGNYEQWIKFFLQALYESADDAITTIDELTTLHNKNVALISNMGRASKNAMLIFEYLEANPIIDISKTAEALNIAFNTVSKAVDNLSNVGILKQTTNYSRNRTFAYSDYLDILSKGTNWNISFLNAPKKDGYLI